MRTKNKIYYRENHLKTVREVRLFIPGGVTVSVIWSPNASSQAVPGWGVKGRKAVSLASRESGSPRGLVCGYWILKEPNHTHRPPGRNPVASPPSSSSASQCLPVADPVREPVAQVTESSYLRSSLPVPFKRLVWTALVMFFLANGQRF